MDTEGNLETILMTVANKLGLAKWRYQRTYNKTDVLNFLGSLIPVLLVDESNGEEIHLVIKRAPHMPELDELIIEVFQRETYVYTTLMPIFKSLNTGVNYEKLFPKCYHADLSEGNQLVVMNDMRTLGFVNYTGKYLDIDHVNVALKAVAQYHALSIILCEKNIKPPNFDILRPITSKDPEIYFPSVKCCIQKYYNALFKHTVHSSFLSKLIDNFANSTDDISLKAKRLVYGHGDFWKENILFEYMDKKPVRACLVDYQISRLTSPAQDVLFLIMNGTNSSTRRLHFKIFLSNYYNELQKTLNSNGIDPRVVYPEEDFHYDLKLVFPFCFPIVFLSFIMWLGFEDLVSISCRTEKDINEGQRKDMEEQLKVIIEDLISDFKGLGYIDDV